MTIDDIVRLCRVIPVLTIDRLEDAVPLCETLAEAGLPVLEITLRTPVALDAVEAVAAALPDAVVGTGTVLTADDLRRARDAGSRFAVSPGFEPTLVQAAAEAGTAYLPGVQTCSEAMAAYRLGLRALKFFPATIAGGPGALEQFAPLFPGLVFCPTGGVGFGNAADYLACRTVTCVGGSFPAPSRMVDARDWAAIRELARQAAAL